MNLSRAKLAVFGLLVALAAFSAQLALGDAPAKVAAAPQGCPEHHPPNQAPVNNAPEPASHLCCAAGHQAALLTTLQPRYDLQPSSYVPLAQLIAVRGIGRTRSFSDEFPGPPFLIFPLRV